MKQKKNLSQREEHFCSFFDDQPEVLRRFLPDGTITFTNDAHCSFFMRQKDIAVGENLVNIDHKEIKDLMQQSLVTLTCEHPERTYERLVPWQDGEFRWVRWTNRAILDENGNIVEYQSIGRDITDLKNTQRELVVRNRELAALKAFVSQLMESSDIDEMMDVADGNDEDEDEAESLNLGSYQDAIQSPGTNELITKVKEAIRSWMHTPISPSPSTVSIGSISIDFLAQRVNVDGQEIHLTATEYRLLSELASAAGQVLATDTILEKVWGNGYSGEAHLVWKVIRRLRQKIEPDPRQPRYIQNEHGRGYLLIG